jgi:hypothetical protein
VGAYKRVRFGFVFIDQVQQFEPPDDDHIGWNI